MTQPRWLELAWGDLGVAETPGSRHTARVVAYGSHVDDTALEQARADGADLVLARSRFFHDPAAAVEGRS